MLTIPNPNPTAEKQQGWVWTVRAASRVVKTLTNSDLVTSGHIWYILSNVNHAEWNHLLIQFIRKKQHSRNRIICIFSFHSWLCSFCFQHNMFYCHSIFMVIIPPWCVFKMSFFPFWTMTRVMNRQTRPDQRRKFHCLKFLQDMREITRKNAN